MAGSALLPAIRTGLLCTVAVAVAACSTPTPPKPVTRSTVGYAANGKTAGVEYFAEKKYGVKASPRVVNVKPSSTPTRSSRLKRGGGRALVGKPYKVAGKWYTPKDEPGYSKVGGASWYGAAFHGRLTANGEIYDMHHLTAAHPTLPLPSYARVTNTANGNSVIVRINDRGPFHGNRIIDLSQRAADMLDYRHSGVAKVKVDYIGPAPVDGQDDEYLLASFQPGPGGRPVVPQPSSDVMIAMNGPTPTDGLTPTSDRMLDPVAFTQNLGDAQPSQPAVQPAAIVPAAVPGDPILPDFGPILISRPDAGAVLASAGAGVLASYADTRVKAAFGATEALQALSEGRIASSEVQVGKLPTANRQRIHVGTFATIGEARTAAAQIGGNSVPYFDGANGTITLELVMDASAADRMLEKAWSAGFADAFAIR